MASGQDDAKFDCDKCGYLDFPRIHFYGQFRANVGTGNNLIINYQLGEEKESGVAEKAILSQEVEISPTRKIKGSEGYNYNGDMTFTLINCNITASYGMDGKPDTQTMKNFEINPSMKQASGRINDLDVWQQMVSCLFGLKINICDKNNGNKCLLSCDYHRASFRNIWQSSVNAEKYDTGSKGGDEEMSCEYTSILTNCQFASDNELSNYSVLKGLKDYSIKNDNKLQMKFIMDGYNGEVLNTEVFTYGRCFGVIGCYTKGDPIRSIKYGRYLYPPGALAFQPAPGNKPQFVGGFNGPFMAMRAIKMNENECKLVIDAMNSMPTTVSPTVTLGDSNFDPKNYPIGDIVIYKHKNGSERCEIARIKENEYLNEKEWKVACGIFCKDIKEEDYNDLMNSVPVEVEFTEMEKMNILRNELFNRAGSLKSNLCELTCGFYVNNEQLAIRLGTYGQYDPDFTKSFDTELFVSIHGTPYNYKKHGKLFELHTQKVAVWGTMQGMDPTTNNDKEPVWVTKELTPSFKFNILNQKECIDGKLKVRLIAPDTLEDQNGGTKLLPRHKWYMDSFVWNLILVLLPLPQPPSGVSGTVAVVANTAANAIAADTDGPSVNKAVAHGDYRLILDASKKDENDEKSEKSKKIVKGGNLRNDSLILNVFVGSVCVWNELEPSKLPAVPLWQPDIITDMSEDNWMNFLKSDDFAKEHTPYVHAILRQYANIYPIMSNIVNMDAYPNVTSKLKGMIRAFEEPFSSVYYMPITREMSGMNRMIVKEWLRNPCFCDSFIDKLELKGGFYGIIKDIDTLKAYLQTAIELELSTLPPYLSALYSMDPNGNGNQRIIKLITSIVHEEMTHFALACNLLLSIGGKPKISYKDVIKRTSFPRKGLTKPNNENNNNINTHVPGVLPHIKLELGPMSVKRKNAAVDTFMHIEAPCNFKLVEDINKATIIAKNSKNIAKKVTVNRRNDDSKGLKSKQQHFHRPMNNDKDKSVQTGPAQSDSDSKEVETELKDPQSTLKKFDSEDNDNLKKVHVVFSMIGDGSVKKADGDSKEFEGMEWLSDVLNDRDSNTDSDTEELEKQGKLGSRHGIGAFYQLIRKGFMYLSNCIKDGEKELFKGVYNNPGLCAMNQIGNNAMNGCNYVYNLETALKAIETIVSEGEGTSITDIWHDESTLSHFHKFLEIKVGYPIVGAIRIGYDNKQHAIYKYVFAKNELEKIRFNEKEVASDAKAWDWLKYNSKEINDTTKHENAKDIRVITFNQTYGKLLVALQDICGGGRNTNVPNAGSDGMDLKYAKFIKNNGGNNINIDVAGIEKEREREMKDAIGLMRQLQIDFSQCLREYNMPGVGVSEKDQITYKGVAPNWVPPTSMMLD